MIQRASCIEKIPRHSTTSALVTDLWEELAMRGEEEKSLVIWSLHPYIMLLQKKTVIDNGI